MEDIIKHIGIIVDGNRRFAKQKSRLSWQGHHSGAETLEKTINWCLDLDIKEVTVYALSTENLKREPREVKELLDLMRKWFKKLGKNKRIHKDQVKIRFIGEKSLLPEDLQKQMQDTEEKTKDYNNYKVNFCVAYGGRLELLRAVQKIVSQNLAPKEITEETIQENLWLSSEPQFIIRTGGAIRTSNFLPWQATYSEWIFLNKFWPEFTKEDLEKCIEKYKSTKRNFGK